jgi:hypothetical protein
MSVWACPKCQRRNDRSLKRCPVCQTRNPHTVRTVEERRRHQARMRGFKEGNGR